jgi:hypothetical protein
VADTPTRFEREAPRARPDRHRPATDPVRAPVTPAAPAAPQRPAKPAAPDRPAPAPTIHDQTIGAIRRPAHLSDRCAGCGASTRGRSRMVTEVVDVGPVRALRVVVCSACPDRRRRDVLI